MSDTRGVPADVEATLHELERLVTEAKAVPLSASIMLNRADLEAVVADLRDAMPDELTQARWVIKERDEILDHARSDAQRLLEEAREEQARLVSEQQVVQTADEEAERILAEAREQGRALRLEAEDYVDAKLANFEVVLNKTLGAVERGRAKLRGNLETDELASTDLDVEFEADAEVEDPPG